MRELKEELEEKIKQYNELEGDYKNLENERYLKVSVSFYSDENKCSEFLVCVVFLHAPSNSIQVFHLKLFYYCRDSIGAQLQLALAKADSEQLARSIAEEQLSDVEKEKTMLELELKEALSRHRDELNKKDIIVTTVSIFIFKEKFHLLFSTFD